MFYGRLTESYDTRHRSRTYESPWWRNAEAVLPSKTVRMVMCNTAGAGRKTKDGGNGTLVDGQEARRRQRLRRVCEQFRRESPNRVGVEIWASLFCPAGNGGAGAVGPAPTLFV